MTMPSIATFSPDLTINVVPISTSSAVLVFHHPLHMQRQDLMLLYLQLHTDALCRLLFKPITPRKQYHRCSTFNIITYSDCTDNAPVIKKLISNNLLPNRKICVGQFLATMTMQLLLFRHISNN